VCILFRSLPNAECRLKAGRRSGNFRFRNADGGLKAVRRAYRVAYVTLNERTRISADVTDEPGGFNKPQMKVNSLLASLPEATA